MSDQNTTQHALGYVVTLVAGAALAGGSAYTFFKDYHSKQAEAQSSELHLKDSQIADLNQKLGQLQQKCDQSESMRAELSRLVTSSQPVIEYRDVQKNLIRYSESSEELKYLLRKVSNVASGWFGKLDLTEFRLKAFEQITIKGLPKKYDMDISGQKFYELRDSILPIVIMITPADGSGLQKTICISPVFRALPENEPGERKLLTGVNIIEQVQPIEILPADVSLR